MKKDNLRKNKRLSVRTPVEIYPVFPSYEEWLADSGRNYLTGRLNDLSRGGLGLTSKRRLLEGSVLKFRFSLRGNRRVEIFGKIVWARRQRAGARFFLLVGDSSKTDATQLSPIGAGPLLLSLS
jgi:hypothetical protein